MQNDEFGQQDFIPILSWTWILHPACMFGFKLLIKTWVFNFNIKSYRSQWFSCLKYLFLLWKWIFSMVWKIMKIHTNGANYDFYLCCGALYFRNHWLKNNMWKIHKSDRICETHDPFLADFCYKVEKSKRWWSF